MKRSRTLAPLLVFALFVTSCASVPRVPAAQASVAVTDVHAAIAKVDDLERALFRDGTLTQAQHDRLNGPILTLLKAGKAFNESVRAAVLVPDATRTHYREAVAAAASALEAIGAALPDGPIKAKLLFVLALAQGAIAGAGTSLMGGGL